MRHKKTWTACYSTVHCRLYSDRARLAKRRTKAIRFLYLMHFVFLASASCDCLHCGSSPKPTHRFLDGILVYTPIKLLARDEIPALMRFDDIKCPPNHAWKQEPCRVSESDRMSCALKPFPRWSSAFILLCATRYARRHVCSCWFLFSVADDGACALVGLFCAASKQLSLCK